MDESKTTGEKPGDGLCRILDVARLLGVSRSHVYALMDKGDLPYVRLGRCRRVPRRAVTELIERNLVTRPSENG